MVVHIRITSTKTYDSKILNEIGGNDYRTSITKEKSPACFPGDAELYLVNAHTILQKVPKDDLVSVTHTPTKAT